MKVDISKREELNTLLNKLTENTIAQWGLMKPQNMIEHLAKTLEYSNGKKHGIQRTSEEQANAIKQAMIYTDAEMPQGIKSGLLGDLPDPFEFANLDEAKRHLNDELNDFEEYFAANPNVTCIQPRLGALTNKEWVIFHGKHFTHHFKQFGLV